MLRFLLILQISVVFWWNSSAFLISSDLDVPIYVENELNMVDYTDDFIHVGTNAGNIMETIYSGSPVGQSHRFYLTIGERQEGEHVV